MNRLVTLAPCDADGFQQAVDDFGADGGTVILEPGVFVIGKTIELPSNIRIIGSGRETTRVVLAKNASCHMFTNKKPGSAGCLEVCCLSIDGNMEHQPRPRDMKGITFACAFYMKGVDGMRVHDLAVYNIRQTGLHFNHCRNIRIRDYVCSRAGWSGVSTTGTDFIDIEARVSEAGLDVRHSGIHLDGGRGARFAGSVTKTTGNGVMLDSSHKDFSHAFVDAHVSECKRGVSLSGFHEHQLRAVSITGKFACNASDGIMVSNASDVTIFRASLVQNRETGILFQGRQGGRNSIVCDCLFDGNRSDIVEQHQSRDNLYFNNFCTATGGAPEIERRNRRKQQGRA